MIKTLLLLSLLSLRVWSFDESKFLNECLMHDYSLKISHKALPFGLLENVIELKKQKCEIDLQETSYIFLHKRWKIDTCREPVHIKAGTHAIDVYKKVDCTSKVNKDNEFCKSLASIEMILQDKGLIFAKGEKENIKSEHGKVYCAYRLIQKYLRDGKIFSRYNLVNQEDEKVSEDQIFAPTVESVQKVNQQTDKTTD